MSSCLGYVAAPCGLWYPSLAQQSGREHPATRMAEVRMSVAKGTAGFKCDDKLFVTMVEELGAADCEDVKVGMRITKWMDEDLAERVADV